ncbi:MAG: hypothetical protein WBN92_01600 [Terriglobia bacterium]
MEQDYKERFGVSALDALNHRDGSNSGAPVVQLIEFKVLTLDAYEESSIRTQVAKGSDIWRRVKQNQDECYHHLKEAQIRGANPGPQDIPDLFISFKKFMSIPAQHLYDGILEGGIKRMALIPDRYVHDLMHRFYSFLSRVGTPD